MNRKEIKQKSKYILKRNYWRSIAVTFFVAFLIGNLNMTPPKNVHNNIELIKTNSNVLDVIDIEITKSSIDKINDIKDSIKNYQPSRGIFANIFNNVVAEESFIQGLLNSLNQMIFHEKLRNGLIILIGAIISFLYWLLVKNPLKVCEARFFLENHNHSKTNFKRMFLPLKVKQNKNIIITMFKKFIYEIVWLLTIVGFVIKHYAYILTPFILAENPKINSKDALKLSDEMMKGHKLEFFKIDLSLFMFQLLDLLTFHLFGIIYLNPYKRCIYTKIYMDLRTIAKKNKIKNSDLLKDDFLEDVNDYDSSENYLYEETNHKWLNTDYNKNYSIISLILIFFTTSIIGWIWEVSLHLFKYGDFVNRGTLHGPWLQIYGFGIVFLLISLRKFRNKPILTFILTIIFCGIIEYFTSWYLEAFNNARWWDYDNFFLNINGRICLEGLIAFGLGSCAFIYFGAPLFESIYTKISSKIKIILIIILCFFFIIDFVYSTIYPNEGSGISQKIEKT